MRFLYLLLISLLLTSIGCEPATTTFVPDRAGAAILLTQASLSDSEVTPSPTPTPDGECANCNGKGWTGDGVTMFPCLVCNADEHIPRPRRTIEEHIKDIIPVSDPPIWHDNLFDALQNHADNGGMLAVIIGSDNCIPCQKRLAEAKSLTTSPYSWVYCKDDDPALAWMEITEVPVTPTFVLVIGNTVTPNVKPETLGLKAEL